MLSAPCIPIEAQAPIVIAVCWNASTLLATLSNLDGVDNALIARKNNVSNRALINKRMFNVSRRGVHGNQHDRLCAKVDTGPVVVSDLDQSLFHLY